MTFHERHPRTITDLETYYYYCEKEMMIETDEVGDVKQNPEEAIVQVQRKDELKVDVVMEESNEGEKPEVNEDENNEEGEKVMIEEVKPDKPEAVDPKLRRSGGCISNHDHTRHGLFPTEVVGLVPQVPPGTCRRCLQEGHNHRDCPNDQVNDCFCFNCGMQNVKITTCPQCKQAWRVSYQRRRRAEELESQNR